MPSCCSLSTMETAGAIDLTFFGRPFRSGLSRAGGRRSVRWSLHLSLVRRHRLAEESGRLPFAGGHSCPPRSGALSARARVTLLWRKGSSTSPLQVSPRFSPCTWSGCGGCAASIASSLPRYSCCSGLYCAQTVSRSRVWKDQVTLNADTVRQAPDENDRVEISATPYWKRQGDEAIEQFRYIITAINPDSETAYYNLEGRSSGRGPWMKRNRHSRRPCLSTRTTLMRATSSQRSMRARKDGRIRQEYCLAMRLQPGRARLIP